MKKISTVVAKQGRNNSQQEVTDGERILYHNEELECGHVHQDFDRNPPAIRRRCRKCL